MYLYLSLTFIFISIITAKYKSKNLWNSLLNSSLIFLYFILTILYFSVDYFTNQGLNEAAVYTAEYGLQGAGFGEYSLLLSLSILAFVIVFAISYLYFKIIKNSIHPKPKKLKGLLHNVFLLLAFLIHPLIIDLYHIYEKRHLKQSHDFNEYYAKPDLQTLSRFGDLNLVYIYAESLEKTYFDETIFPDLVPKLKDLKKSSIEFTNINQVAGTGWTIAGMTASQCSIPLFTASGGNAMQSTDTFLSGAVCLGDVLSKVGYHLTFIQGSSVEFSGIKQFYSSHHFSEIYGRDKIKDHLDDQTYINHWGLYDDSLFAIAFDKFESLSKQDKPFGLFMATLDTHHPDGHVSKSCSDLPYKDGLNKILNAVYCSDYLISQFIAKIQNSDYAEKTLIVLTSDHLAMKNTATKMLDINKRERRNLFLIFDPKSKKYVSIKKPGSMLDVAPTILHKLGINTQLGLGRNLLKQESLYTLFDNFNQKLQSWRHDILKFFEFPKVSENYSVSTKEKKVNIAQHTYTFPVLFKIDQDNQLIPIFEIHSSKKLFQYISEFTPVQKFVWIDVCRKINIAFDLNHTADYCAAQGSIAGNIEVIPLKKDILNINISHILNDTKINMTQFHTRLKNLKPMIDCQKPPKGKVSLTSSSKPNDKNIPSAFRTFYKNTNLYLTFDKYISLRMGLNLLTIDQNGEYNVENFNVYGSHTEAIRFLATVEPLIRQKKFWAIAASHAIKNTYPNYKEKLIKLGFKLLPTLNLTVAYIAYQDENGNIYEYSDKATICKVIPSFIKPLTDEEIKILEREKKQKYTKAKIYSKDVNRFIAHAGGAIDGNTYTNSFEALNASYENGFRLFELDILETSDDIFVAAHGWKEWQKMTKYEGKMPPTRDIFKSYKHKDRYTPLDISDINRWFKEHPDAILITDKINKPIEFSRKFIDKSRLMMELFTWSAVKQGIDAKIKSSMPTGNILRQIRGDKVTYLKKLGITDIASSRRIINTKRSLVKKIVDEGIHIYAFHINYDKGKDEKYVLCEENPYFYGMYADNWDFNTNIDCTKF